MSESKKNQKKSAPTAALRWDVSYGPDGVRPVEHFCRVWHDGQGCYGTNPDHGFSWDEVRAEIVRFHKEQVDYWAKLSEKDYLA